jgi:hypothetical protein
MEWEDASKIQPTPSNSSTNIKYPKTKEQMKDVTYGQFVCMVRPEKAEPNHTRFMVGRDKINYPGEVATPTADMLVAKMLFNSIILTR